MPEERSQPESQPSPVTPYAELYGDPEPPPVLDEEALARATSPAAARGVGSLGRLVSVIVSVGLAWALVVAISAWVLGTFLARG